MSNEEEIQQLVDAMKVADENFQKIASHILEHCEVVGLVPGLVKALFILTQKVIALEQQRDTPSYN